MSKITRVCILTSLEAEELSDGIKPKCSDHSHLTAEEAWDECAPAWQRLYSQTHEPVSRWVGPRHIVRTRAKCWKKVYVYGEMPGGPGTPSLQMVESAS